MTIADKSGNHTIWLRGNEFLKYKSYFEKDLFLFVKGTYKQFSYTDKKDGSERLSRPNLKVSQMMALSEVLNLYTKVIHFQIDLSDITPEFCKELEKIIHRHKGKIPLEADILDPVQNLTLTLRSRNLCVDVHSILPYLDKMPEIKGLTLR